jgi:hypothetical protein
MERDIKVFGTSEICEDNPISSARDMVSFLITNIKLVRDIYDLWSTNNIDQDAFDLVMIEGLEKIEIFSEEIHEAIELEFQKQRKAEVGGVRAELEDYLRGMSLDEIYDSIAEVAEYIKNKTKEEKAS